MSSRIDTEDSDSEALRPETLRLPTLTPAQMERGMNDLRRMDAAQLENIASLMSTMDPRLIETVFRAQGIDYSAEDISRLTTILTPSTIQKIASFTKKKHQTLEPVTEPKTRNEMSNTIAKRIQRDPKQVEAVLKWFYILSIPFLVFFNITKLLVTGPRKFYFFPAVVGAICYFVSKSVGG